MNNIPYPPKKFFFFGYQSETGFVLPGVWVVYTKEIPEQTKTWLDSKQIQGPRVITCVLKVIVSYTKAFSGNFWLVL